MENLECPTVAERLYGLSLIWQEANYNFAFFDRVPDLDWDASYRDFIPQVIAAEDLFTYYDLLERFTAQLHDGHTVVLPPRPLHLSLDRPKLALMNIGGAPVVTNASRSIGQSVPIGAELVEIDGMAAEEYLAAYVLPVVCETTPHRRRDHAVARLLLGKRGSLVRCAFRAPGGGLVELALPRNRQADPEPWLRPSGVPDPAEFMYFDEWIHNEAPFNAFDFRLIDGADAGLAPIGYVALHSFMFPGVVESFNEKLPVLRGCSGIILDLRKNHGGQDDKAYQIASHFLRRSTERVRVSTRKNVADKRAAGAAMDGIPAAEWENLADWQRESLLCFRKQWFEVEDWGQVDPASERLDCPTAVLTGSETGSAAEDFLLALESGQGGAIRIGTSTAGSSGQPLMEALPGGGMVGICTVRMPWPEEVARKGIEPHIWVEPLVEDVIRGEDRALGEAVRVLKNQ